MTGVDPIMVTEYSVVFSADRTAIDLPANPDRSQRL